MSVTRPSDSSDGKLLVFAVQVMEEIDRRGLRDRFVSLHEECRDMAAADSALSVALAAERVIPRGER